MSFCDGAQFKVTVPTGGWWLAVGNDRASAFAALTSLISAAAKDKGFECAGRECRKNPRALCRDKVTVVPAFAGKVIKGRKVVVCMYKGDVTLKCECYLPAKK
jgi:hypothetical protein